MDSRQTQYKALGFAIPALASTVEHTSLHWVDTSIRRLQVSHLSFNWQTWLRQREALGKVVFLDAHDKGGVAKLRSLYSGFGASALYKAVTRTFRYPGQGFISNEMETHLGSQVRGALGEHYGNLALQATSGSAIGGLEAIVFAPADSFKIKRQNGDIRSVLDVLRKENIHLFNGVGAACARNIPGSFAHFGVAAAVMSYFPNEEDHGFRHHMLASALGAVAAVVTTNPQDVIKTRVQTHNGSHLSALTVFKQALTEEGMYSLLTRGLMLRMLQAGPKLAIPMALTRYLTQLWEEYTATQQATAPSPKQERPGV